MPNKTETRSLTNKPVGELSLDELTKHLMKNLTGELDGVKKQISDCTKSFSSLQKDLQTSIDSNQNSIKDVAVSVTNLVEFKDDILARLKYLEGEDKASKAKIAALEKSDLQKSIQLNYYEQRGRSRSLVIKKFKVEPTLLKDAPKLAKHVYTELLQPIMEKACEAGDIDYVPSPYQLIEYLHPLPVSTKKKEASTPLPVGMQQPEPEHEFVANIICRLSSRFKKFALVKHKADFFKTYNKGKVDSEQVYMVDDRTSQNSTIMRLLYEDDNINKKKIQIRNSRVRFQRVGETSYHYIKNPFAKTVDEALKNI